MFGPALVAAIGSFLTFIFFAVALVVTAPAIQLFVMKDIRERDAISDKLDQARQRFDTVRTEMYERHLKEAEEMVNTKINIIFILFITTIIILTVTL